MRESPGNGYEAPGMGIPVNSVNSPVSPVNITSPMNSGASPIGRIRKTQMSSSDSFVNRDVSGQSMNGSNPMHSHRGIIAQQQNLRSTGSNISNVGPNGQLLSNGRCCSRECFSDNSKYSRLNTKGNWHYKTMNHNLTNF